MTVLERSDLSIAEQIKLMDGDIDSRLFNIRSDLELALANVKINTNVTANYLADQITQNIREVVRLQAINILLDVLTHPQRFEIFATLAGNVKEQSDEQG